MVVWTKPARPDWMDAELYAELPAELTLRELRFRVEQRGYRSKEIVVATTLCDGSRWPKKDLADLYHKRWHVELDIRAIKQTLKMEHLRAKTPAMLERELWVHLLGYNLVRKVVAEAAWTRGLCPRQLSFASAVAIVEAFRWAMLCSRDEVRATVNRAVLLAVATHAVGDRPGRCEPRAVKRRPKPYPRLQKPRAEARAELLRR